MRIADVLRNKGAAVATITPETSVAGLLTELTVHNIGAMVVVSPDGLVGIVSERDVVRKLHELGPELLRMGSCGRRGRASDDLPAGGVGGGALRREVRVPHLAEGCPERRQLPRVAVGA